MANKYQKGIACPHCRHAKLYKDGILRRYKDDKGCQRYKCWNCGRTTIKPIKGKGV